MGYRDSTPYWFTLWRLSMYKVWMINFGTVVFVGTNFDQAKAAAVATGFECALSDDDMTMAWSPISGWRTLYDSSMLLIDEEEDEELEELVYDEY
jgi:hypothetical protein